MKYLLFISILFLAINTFSQGNRGIREKSSQAATSANAPKTGKKASGNEVAMEELHLNKPPTSKQQTGSPVPQKTKLDDLKNPFDSTKKVKPGVQSVQGPASQKGRANRQ